MNDNSKNDFVWEYGYGKVIRKMNELLTNVFEQRKKEPERNVKIWITLANGEKIVLNELPEFNVVEFPTITK